MTDNNKEHKGVLDSFSKKHPWLLALIFILSCIISPILLCKYNVFKNEILNITGGIEIGIILILIVFVILEVRNNHKHGQGWKQSMFGDFKAEQKSFLERQTRRKQAFVDWLFGKK